MNTTQFLEERKCRFERAPHHPAFGGQRLAHELHVPGQVVAKTVLLRTGANGGFQFVVAVLPANKRVDLRRAGDLLRQGEVTLATEDDMVSHFPDCDAGVLPPFGSHYGMRTIADSSLAKDREIWFEGNTRNEAIKMKFDDFRRLEQPWIAMFAADD